MPTAASLDALMTAHRVSNTSLAHLMRQAGQVRGLRLATTHTRVKAWRDGQRPHHDALPVLLEALSQRLGRPVGAADIGLAEPADSCAAYPPVITTHDA